VTVAALVSGVVTAALWSLGVDTAALVCAEAGLLAALTACRIWGRQTEGAAEPVARPAPGPWPPSEPVPGPRPAGGQAGGQADEAFVGIAQRIQATVNQQLHDLRRMQDRHGDTPEVFGDLLRLDHGVSLIGRLADSLAVLGGAAPGRRRTRPVDLLDVVRGALSRIVDYRRVDVEVSADAAVVAAVVEPVVHALAELLDNATRYSPPQTRVRVSAEPLPGLDGARDAGLTVVVEDAGVGLDADALRYAARVLSPAGFESDPVRPAGPPRLGLTVVGRLARDAGFTAVVEPRPGGGARATLRLPAALVTAAPAAPEPAGATVAAVTAGCGSAPAVPRQSGPRPFAPPVPSGPPAVGPTGLPHRRRTASPLPDPISNSAPDPAPNPLPNAAPVAAEPDDPEPGAGRWLNAFMGGKDGGRP
jgi:hypothetical protein